MTNRSVSIHFEPVAGREFRSVTGYDPTWHSKRMFEEPRPRYGTVGEDLVEHVGRKEHQKEHGSDRGLGCSGGDACG